MKLHSILCRYIISTFKHYREYSLGECRWSLSGKKMTSFGTCSRDCRRSLPLNSYSMFLFPTDKLTVLWTINKYTCLISETADSQTKKKNVFHVCIHREPTAGSCTGGKTHVESVNYRINMSENMWGWKRTRDGEKQNTTKRKEKGRSKREKRKGENLWRQLFLLARRIIIFLIMKENWKKPLLCISYHSYQHWSLNCHYKHPETSLSPSYSKCHLPMQLQ